MWIKYLKFRQEQMQRLEMQNAKIEKKDAKKIQLDRQGQQFFS